MNKLDKLIQELCPNGVERKSLWELTAWDKKFNGIDRSMQKVVIPYKYYLSADFEEVERPNGDVLYIATGITSKKRYTTEELAGEYLFEGEIVCIPWGGTPNVKYHKGKFVTGDNRIATSLNTDILDNKYLYYWMQSQIEVIASFYRGAGIQHPSMRSVLEMKVPLPPVEVQREIVHILDRFTLLTAELTAELTARRKQYEYYAQHLLAFDSSVQTSVLRELVDFRNGKGHERNIVDDGEYVVVNSKFISTNGEVKKYSDRQISPLFLNDILMVMSDLPNGRALAKCFLVDENDKYTLNQRIGAFHVKENKLIDTKFLMYILNRNPQLLKYDNGVDQTNLKKDDILNIIIPVPSLEEQERIVSILDRFDALCNDIAAGLPAEIEARQKQYEYYRDKLLTFKEIEV